MILVVGPSGAGKDTLIAAAAAAFPAGTLHVARRIVTRAASVAEDHDVLDPAHFAAARDAGDFAIVWEAHGLAYAVPRTIETWLAAGSSVLCNVSRSVVEALRARYPRVAVVYVDAPLAVRRERVAKRRRSGETPDRAERRTTFTPDHADGVVDNGESLDEGIARFNGMVAVVLGAQGSRSGGAKLTLPGTSVE